MFFQFGDRELIELWSELQLKLGKLFDGVNVQPSLVHGDLWSGNAGHIHDQAGRDYFYIT